jgi:hypothetical protein
VVAVVVAVVVVVGVGARDMKSVYFAILALIAASTPSMLPMQTGVQIDLFWVACLVFMGLACLYAFIDAKRWNKNN